MVGCPAINGGFRRGFFVECDGREFHGDFPADRRRHIVELSAGGQDELCLAQARLSRVEDDLLGALSRDERATLYRLLARAVDAVGKPSTCTEADPPSAC